MAFGRKVTFGRKQQSMAELQAMMREPDADGIARVFPKELWDDPAIGKLLRDVGMDPDDERNIIRSADDWIATFKAAEQRLAERTVAFSREMEARHGYCRAMPLLVIGRDIYNGEHGAFLYAQMDLIGFDDWNVIWCAADQQTKDACGLPGYPFDLPQLTEAVLTRVKDWHNRHEFILETFGITATGGMGISRQKYERETANIRQEILDWVESMKPRIVGELDRMQRGYTPPEGEAA